MKKNFKPMKTVNIADHLVTLTKTGLAVHPIDENNPFMPFYCSNDGEFRRYMSHKEAESLPLQAIKFLTYGIDVNLPNKWKFLWSWKVSDYTSYKPETCCNGGDYAFHETHNIFGRLNAGKLELLDVVRHTTSAEFRYDEAKGSFQTDGMAEARFIDVEGDFTLYTQTGDYDENGYPQDREFSLNQFGIAINWFDAVNAGDLSFGMEGDEEPFPEDATCGPVEAERRLEILKETFNWEPPKRR